MDPYLFGRRASDAADVAMLDRLAAAAAAPEDPTRQHPWRVASLAGRIAVAMALNDIEVDLVCSAARYHDVGKIGVPAELLATPGPLTGEQRRLVQCHTTIGQQMLSSRRSPLLRVAAEIAVTHHERWDGAGYPRRLRGTSIPIAGRIVCVADAWDALTSHRPYRPACTEAEALIEIGCHAGSQFDPVIVDALLRALAATVPMGATA